MQVGIIYLAVTGAGILFVTLSFAIIILGKNVGGPDGVQMIKITDRFEITQNSALGLVFLSGAILLTPLILINIYGDLDDCLTHSQVDSAYMLKETVARDYLLKDSVAKDYMDRTEVDKNYILRGGHELIVHGIVQDEKQNSIADATVTVIAGEGESEGQVRTDLSGLYFVKLKNIAPGEKKFQVIVTKDGFRRVQQMRSYAYDRQTLPVTLTTAEEN